VAESREAAVFKESDAQGDHLARAVDCRAAPHGFAAAPRREAGERRALRRGLDQQVCVWGFPCRHPLGENKEGLPLEQTTEVVVYTLSGHMPVYYRTFPGNMPGSRSLDTILTDLDLAGLNGLVLVTDCGYDTLRNLEKYMLRGPPMVMCAKAGQRDVSKAIRGLGEFGTRPDGMTVDSDAKIYHIQYEIDYTVESIGNSAKEPDRLKLNLYFGPVRRSLELMELDIALSAQESALREFLESRAALVDAATAKRDFCYYVVAYDPATMVIKSYERNEKKISKARMLSGFFSIMTHGVGFGAMETFRTYGLRDEQEKYFQQMKNQMVFTSLYHLINEDLLRSRHRAMDGKKATGVDNVSGGDKMTKNAEQKM